MKYKVKCIFTVEVEAENMDMAFVEAMEAIDIHDDCEMEAEELEEV